MRRAIIVGIIWVIVIGCFAEAETIKIGLLRRFNDAKSVFVSCTGKFQIADKSGAIVLQSNPGDKISIQVNQSQILLIDTTGNNIAAEPPFCITSCSLDDRIILYQNQNDKGTRYRGKISVLMNKSGILLINELDIEDYLLGVLPCEMPESYHSEALKAQAVAARSYALANRMKHYSQGFSLCDSSDCQIYGGAEVERPKASAAVRDTAGLVAVFNGQVISAQYTGDCGGITAEGRQPYLQSVSDCDDKGIDMCDNPQHTWSAAWNIADFENILKPHYPNLSGIKDIAIERTSAGRPYLVKIKADSGDIEITASKLRMLVGINVVKSTYFTAKIIDGAVILSGRGMGHGVGMCQIGANARAKQGASFEQILKHYYSGIQILPMSDLLNNTNSKSQ